AGEGGRGAHAEADHEGAAEQDPRGPVRRDVRALGTTVQAGVRISGGSPRRGAVRPGRARPGAPRGTAVRAPWRAAGVPRGRTRAAHADHEGAQPAVGEVSRDAPPSRRFYHGETPR